MISKDDWKGIEERLDHAYGSAKLKVDGYEISLSVEKGKNLRYEIMVYVNGWFRGEWLNNDCEERRRFFRRRSFYVYKRKQRESLRKLSKRLQKQMGIDLDKKLAYYTPYWPSFKPLKAHLLRNNKDIKWIDRPIASNPAEAAHA